MACIRTPNRFVSFQRAVTYTAAWWERRGRGWISVSLYRMVRPSRREHGRGKHEGVRTRGETGGIAFMLVVSFGLGNFGRWLVRGAQSGLPDLTWLAEIPRQFPIIRGPDAAAQPSGLLLLFQPRQPLWLDFSVQLKCVDYQCPQFIMIVMNNYQENCFLIHILSFRFNCITLVNILRELIFKNKFYRL